MCPVDPFRAHVCTRHCLGLAVLCAPWSGLSASVDRNPQSLQDAVRLPTGAHGSTVLPPCCQPLCLSCTWPCPRRSPAARAVSLSTCLQAFVQMAGSSSGFTPGAVSLGESGSACPPPLPWQRLPSALSTPGSWPACRAALWQRPEGGQARLGPSRTACAATA